MSTIRSLYVENTTGAVLATPSATVTKGKDYAIKFLERKIAAIDIGVEAGKMGNASGALAFTPTGDVIKSVISCVAVDKDDGAVKGQTAIFAKIDANGNLVLRDKYNPEADPPEAPSVDAGDSVFITFVTGAQ